MMVSVSMSNELKLPVSRVREYSDVDIRVYRNGPVGAAVVDKPRWVTRCRCLQREIIDVIPAEALGSGWCPVILQPA